MTTDVAPGTEQIDPILAAGMNVPLFRNWMTDNVPEFQPGHFTIRRLAGGESNLTMLIEQDGKRWVLRRPPMGPYPPSGHDMGREFLFYRSMQGTAVPVPRTRGLCTDEAVLGAPFYVMDFMQGRIIATAADAQTVDEAGRRGLCDALARTMAAIHTVDIDAVGLGTVARRGDYLQRQVKRWTSQWESFDPAENPAIGEIGRRLTAAMPKTSQTTVVHGDYRIGNVMVAPDDPARIIAVLDWEMATLGDPLADLGYTLIYWGSAYPYIEPSAEIPDLPGFMTEAELIDAYERAGGAKADSIDYYKILAWFKLAVMCQSYIERGRADGKPSERTVRHRDAMAATALETADRSHIAGLNGR
jgi:aminoglycoside phosphotransferase (APT) family kinase protein